MNKNIGYGASLLVLAAAGGLFFSASTAEATGTNPGGGMNDCQNKLTGLCACVQGVVESIRPNGNGGTGSENSNSPQRIRADLEQCLHDFCPAEQPCDAIK